MLQPRDQLATMPKDALAIHRIRVEKLFGRYSYDLRSEVSATQATKLLILYGDNGSGKTTLLQLIFHLLSHIDKSGHKSFLAKTKFKSIAIDLGKHTQVIAKRRGKKIIGTYTALVKQRGKELGRIEFNADKNNDVIRPEGHSQEAFEKKVQRFLKCLENLRIALFFVTDDRQLLQNEPRRSDTGQESEEFVQSAGGRLRLKRSPRTRGKYLDAAVSRAVKVAVQWAREQVLSGSKQGEADANTIY